MKVERDIVVSNEHGLHARPAMQLVEMANRFESDIALVKLSGEAPGDEPVDAKSVTRCLRVSRMLPMTS